MVFAGFMSSSVATQSQLQRQLRRTIAITAAVCASFTVSGCAWHQQPVLPNVFRGAQTLEGRRLPNQRDYWTAFCAPSRFNATGLYLLEPYQPDRIPLILIHGLASDAMTWDEMIVALKSHPHINTRYQIWCYQYPTGNSYLKAAADLREELINTRARLDPSASNPAFDQTVLVGHSMRGLVANSGAPSTPLNWMRQANRLPFPPKRLLQSCSILSRLSGKLSISPRRSMVPTGR